MTTTTPLDAYLEAVGLSRADLDLVVLARLEQDLSREVPA